MQVDFPKMRRGGLDAGFFIVYVKQGELTAAGYEKAYEQAQAKFAAIERMLKRYPEEIAQARTPDELERLVEAGKLVAVIGIENAYPLGPEFKHLAEFHERGGRYISLTHVGHNEFASSSIPPGAGSGVTDLGQRLIGEMNRLGIMVDVSHVSDAAFDVGYESVSQFSREYSRKFGRSPRQDRIAMERT